MGCVACPNHPGQRSNHHSHQGFLGLPPFVTMSAFSVVSQDIIDALDVEAPPPSQHLMAKEGKHSGLFDSFTAGSSPLNHCAPSTGDTAYSKCICTNCGIGEFLGDVICGNNGTCFCITCQAKCGLKDSCPDAGSSCNMMSPKCELDTFYKCFCCKVGLSLPAKPFLVCVGKELF